MPDTGAEAARQADQSMESMKRTWLSAMQREFTNRGNRDGEDSSETKIEESKRKENIQDIEGPNIETDHFEGSGESIADFDAKDEDREAPARGTEDPAEKDAFESGDTVGSDSPEQEPNTGAAERNGPNRDPGMNKNPADDEFVFNEEKFEGLKEHYGHVKDVTLASSPEERNEKFGEYGEYLKEKTTPILDEYAKNNPEKGVEVENIRDLFSQHIDNACGKGEDVSAELKSALDKNPDLKNELSQVVDMDRFTDDPVGMTVDRGSGIIGSTKEDIGDMTNMMQESGKSIKEELTEVNAHIEAYNPTTLEKVKSDIMVFGKEVEKFTKNLNECLIGATSNVVKECAEKFNEAYEKLKELAFDTLEKAGINKDDLTKIKDAVDKGEEILEKGFDDVRDGVEKGMSTIEEAVDKVGKSGKDKSDKDMSTISETVCKFTKGDWKNSQPDLTDTIKGKVSGKATESTAKKIAHGYNELMKKSHLRGIIGSTAMTNPYSAVVYMAVQVAISSVKYFKSKSNEKDQSANQALTGEKSGNNGKQKNNKESLER